MIPRLRHSRSFAFAFASLSAASLLVTTAPSARAEDIKPECATLLEKASGFARFDATYPQARADLKECSAGRCTGNRALVEVCKSTLKKLDDTVPVFVKIKADAALSGAAQLSFDGEPATKSTVQGNTGYRLKAGHHTVLVKAEGFTDGQREIVVDADADEAARTFDLRLTRATSTSTAVPVPRVSPAPAPAPPPAATEKPTPEVAAPEAAPTQSSFPYRPVAVVAGAVGLASLAVGFGLGANALQKKDAAGCDAASRCATDAQTSTLLGAKDSATASTIFVVAGGALVVGGVVLWVLRPTIAAQKSASRLRVMPAFGPGASGLFATGVF